MIYGTFRPQVPKDKILSGVNATILFTRNSPRKNTEVGCHSLLQGIFPTQGWNPGLPHCWQIHYCLSHWEAPVLYKTSTIKGVCRKKNYSDEYTH